MGDWLGTGNVAATKMTFRSFEDARSFVRGLNLRSGSEWNAYCKGQLPGKGTKPADIPAVAARKYKDVGWAGWGDWLGTGRTATHLRQYRSFAEARDYAHSLKLKSQIEWRKFAKTAKRTRDIPASPIKVYKKEWIGWRDWLGNEMRHDNERGSKPRERG